MTNSAWTIVAVLSGADGPMFDRAPVVVESNGVLREGGRWNPEPTGSPLTDEDLDDLVRSGQATRLRTPLRARGRPLAWIFERGLSVQPYLDAIDGALLAREDLDTGTLLIVDESEVSGLLGALSDQARDRAWEALKCGEPAMREAKLAWLMAPRPRPEHVALLLRAARTPAEQRLAEDILAIERNSQGEWFDRRVAELYKVSVQPEIRRISKGALSADLVRPPTADRIAA